MKNAILQKAQKDSAYSQIVQIYSGLFDTQDERETFILDVAGEDVLLAAECKVGSVEGEYNLRKNILEKSFIEYSHKKNERTITNYCLVLINFDLYDKLQNIIIELNSLSNLPKKGIERIINKIIRNYKRSILDMLFQIFDSIENLYKYFFPSLNYDLIDFDREKENILKISTKLANKDTDLLFLYLMEKNTNYLLFEKDLVIERVKKHFDTNKVYKITILWIEKYKINELFSNEYVFAKIIETEYWSMAFDFIENINSVDKKKTALIIINNAIEKNVSIVYLLKMATKYDVINKLSANKLIDYALKQNSYLGFEKIIKTYGITDIDILKKGVHFLINKGNYKSYLNIINNYSLQSIFSLEYLIEYGNLKLYDEKAFEMIKQVYNFNDILINDIVAEIERYYDDDKLGLAIKMINHFNLWSKFNLNKFINKAFELKKWGLLSEWYKKSLVTNKYKITDIIQSAVNSNNLYYAYKISIEFNLKFSDFYKIIVGCVVQCSVKKIVNSRVFVKIEFETRPASIYIGELSNKYIPNIFDFEYNGEKLHIGQKLIAKVISIDEKGRINLSLKQVEKNSH